MLIKIAEKTVIEDVIEFGKFGSCTCIECRVLIVASWLKRHKYTLLRHNSAYYELRNTVSGESLNLFLKHRSGSSSSYEYYKVCCDAILWIENIYEKENY